MILRNRPTPITSRNNANAGTSLNATSARVNNAKYIPRPESYLVIGYTREGRPDTDLFLSRASEVAAPATSKPATGGIRLVD